MADDEEQERPAAATPEEPGAAPAPDLAPAEPSPGRSTPAPPPATSSGPSLDSPSGVRRDDNPFSFRHFLKGDRAPAGAYERTGARPKTYGAPAPPSVAAGAGAGGEAGSARRGGAGGYREPLGMPSLPDFVQDHILVEQAYLESAEPIDLHNLPDFTSLGGGGGEGRAERVPPGLHPHLDLDLTESVYDRRRPAAAAPRSRAAPRLRVAPSHAFPLDLPPPSGGHEEGEVPEGAAGEAMPDFLPPHPRASPAASPAHHAPAALHRLQSQLHNTRSELSEERARTARLERELGRERATADALRTELRSLQHHRTGEETAGSELDPTVASLKAEIKRLKEALETARAQQLGAARDLRGATSAADASLRELLVGLDRLRSISFALEPP